MLQKFKENVRAKRRLKFLMLQGCFGEKKNLKFWTICRLKRLVKNRKYFKNLKIRAKTRFENFWKKKIFLSLKFKNGENERQKFLIKKSFLGWKFFDKKIKEKSAYKEEILDNYWYRLIKTTFRKWKVYRVQCLRRKNQKVSKN